MTHLTDTNYRQIMGRATYALAGLGFDEQRIDDFEAKFALFRSMVGMTESEFPDIVFARLLFGEQPPSTGEVIASASTFSRKKRGTVAFLAEDAASMAQLMNHCAGLPPEQLSRYHGAVFDADAIDSMMNKAPGNVGLRAVDLTLPILDFAGRLAGLVASVSTQVGADILHDRVIAHLNVLRRHCDRVHPVTFHRERDPEVEIPRFGAEQTVPKQPPWEWDPLVFRAGDTPIVGLDAVSDKPCELWALTIRDPRPAVVRDRQGEVCWEEPWENLVRWSPSKAVIPAGEPLTVDYGKIVAKRGEYSVYLLADEGACGNVRRVLDVQLGEQVPMRALYRLLDAAARSKDLGFRCFTRRYRVRVVT